MRAWSRSPRLLPSSIRTCSPLLTSVIPYTRAAAFPSQLGLRCLPRAAAEAPAGIELRHLRYFVALAGAGSYDGSPSHPAGDFGSLAAGP